MFHPQLFADKVALVTGGRSGIGFAIAKQMLQLGAKVVICSRKEDLLKKSTEELRQYGECTSLPCDIRKSEDLQALAEFIKTTHGRLDILVNNAGGQFPSLSEYISDKGWRAVIDNNLNGTFFAIREMANTFFLPQSQGIIVNIIASINRGFPAMAHTAAARAGVENLTKSLAQEWAASGIRINCVAPGIIESSGLETYPQPVQDMFAEAQKAIPLQRFGQVEDISNAVCFLASPLAAYISGIALYVDGAQHLNFDNMGLANLLKSYL
ncbi:SDR family oxidoreductase [Lewinella sp. LCG006]|uniref:SDR family oxidoreductase n=1 Tax=Lewinella sp. LCG006 TaxID=3231911 RepID=UPI00346156E9